MPNIKVASPMALMMRSAICTETSWSLAPGHPRGRSQLSAAALARVTAELRAGSPPITKGLDELFLDALRARLVRPHAGQVPGRSHLLALGARPVRRSPMRLAP